MTELKNDEIDAVAGAFVHDFIIKVVEVVIEHFNPPGVDLNGDGKIGF